MKKILTIAILTFASFAVQAKDKIYYFHGTARCASCKKIEQFTAEAFNENFKDQLNFVVLNVEEPENAHFIKDYNLYTKSVILSKIENGKEVKFKNLDQIWYLIGHKNKFKEYIKNSTNQFLIANKGK